MSVIQGGCLLSGFYIKPQLLCQSFYPYCCCLLSGFYIKPQHPGMVLFAVVVVYYQDSTSNHNATVAKKLGLGVVYYQDSTSNHNSRTRLTSLSIVVYYQDSTSNHNRAQRVGASIWLSIIRILHQTTTAPPYQLWYPELSIIRILHQTTTRTRRMRSTLPLSIIRILHQTTTAEAEADVQIGCLLSGFYIKPQLPTRVWGVFQVVYYQDSTSNHNFWKHIPR